MFKKTRGAESKQAYHGHVLVEKRHGLVVCAKVSRRRSRPSERLLPTLWMRGRSHRITLGADKNDDTRDFVGEMREMKVTPHVAPNDANRSSAIDERTTCHSGYATSQTIRKRIEGCFGWAKILDGLRKSRFIGREKLDFQFVMTFAAHPVRMRNLGVVLC